MDLERRLYEALQNAKASSRAPRPDLFKVPPCGSIRETIYGPVWMVETCYDEGYLHGRVDLKSDIAHSFLEILDPPSYHNGFHFSSTAVIDTETTGLAGGTGTYAFIIGTGFWRETQFIVRQYILRDFFEEPAQLAAFAADLKSCTSLMSYNGKTFDIPLLRSRFRINRQPVPFETLPHFDFMHPCRRLYKRHFDSLNLSHLEYRLLGFERIDDVPSHLIPRIYFDYLQHREDNVLLPILNHNREDIISLYILAQETIRRIELALDGASNDDLLMLALGKILYKSGESQKSQAVLANIKTQFSGRDVFDEKLMLSSRAARRARDWQNAVEHWRQMIKTGRFGCYPYIELAKFYEHREKDIQRAIELTSNAIKLLEFEREFISAASYKIQLESLLQRQRRLKSKLGHRGE